MASITTRETSAGVGDRTGITNANAPLTNAQIDANFIALNNDKLEISDGSESATPSTVVKRTSNGSINVVGLDASGQIDAQSLILDNALAITEGGTGATTASAARTALGLAIGTNVQAYDGDLGAIAGIASTGFAYRSATNTWQAGHVFSAADLQLRSIGIGTAASGTSGEIRATNQITAYYSDERLKKDIKLIPNAMDKVMTLRGVTYHANELAESFGYDTKEDHVGVIAQDVKEVLPEAVKPAPFDRMIFEGKEFSKSGQEYMTVQYEKLVPLLIEAIKELKQEIEQLKESK
jgi:hypothetical protein